MPREINSRTGNYHDRQDEDLFQSVEDRLHTDRGSRVIWPTYGFPAHWPQLRRSALRRAIEFAIGGDEFADFIGFRMRNTDLIVDVDTVSRPDY